MSVLTAEREANPVGLHEWSDRRGRRATGLVGRVIRLAIGILLCTTLPTAILVVGWTRRWMRRRFLHGLWKRSGVREAVSFEDLAASADGEVPSGPTPRWVVSEHFLKRLGRATKRGTPPSRIRRAARLPGLMLASLWANFRAGLGVLACTAVLVLPGAFFLLGGWEYGWNISFYKGYEQAFVGRTVAFVGVLLTAGAMLYVPMASAHLAASGDPRAFFQFRFVGGLIRRRLVAMTFYAVLFVLLTAPATFLWMMVLFLPEMFPWLADASPESLARFAERYRLVAACYVFPAYLVVHLLSLRIYRGALLGLVVERPEAASALPPSLRRPLEMLPGSPGRRRHPVVAVVLGTGRRGRNALLWPTAFAIWLLLPAQMLVAQFFVWHPWLVWFNPVLVNLPCVWVVPR